MIDNSKRFLTGYVKILRNLKDSYAEEIIKGKKPMLESTIQEQCISRPKVPPDKRWEKTARWVG
jgi:hypothetical protein